MAIGDSCPHGNTWAKRQLGDKYDPEIHCPYTTRRLWQFASASREGELGPKPSILYWRADGVVMRARAMTPAELAWIQRNPGPFMASVRKFWAWRDKFHIS